MSIKTPTPLAPATDVPVTRQTRLAFGGLMALIAGLCIYAIRQVDPDMFGHLNAGRLIVQHGGPGIDPFAFTSSGFEWMDVEYLAQALLWIAYDHFGSPGLIGLKLALGGGTIYFLWIAVRSVGDDWFILAPVFLLCTSTVSRYFIFRPQLITFACFALFVAVLFRFMMARKAALWLLPPVMLVWANAHGGFIAGLGAVGLTAIMCVTANVNVGGLGGRTAFKGTTPLFVTLAACAAVTFINPWGIRQWQYLATELSNETNRRYILEWRPPGFSVDPWSWVALIVITATLLAVGWIAERRRLQIGGLHAWQWVLSAVPLISLAYLSVRHVPLAALWAAPVITLLGTAVNRSGPVPAFRRAWLVVSSVALIPVVLTVEFVAAHPAPVIAMGGATLGVTDPCRVVKFMKETRLNGNLYNPLWWGSYVSWELYPAVRVSMDGRNVSLFPDSMVAENLKFYSRDAGVANLEDPLRYNTDFLLVPSDAAILGLVQSDARWRQLYRDDHAFLFARADVAHASLGKSIDGGSTGSASPCTQIFK